jgi:hypothetical protein
VIAVTVMIARAGRNWTYRSVDGLFTGPCVDRGTAVRCARLEAEQRRARLVVRPG